MTVANGELWQAYPAGDPDLADEFLFRDVSDNISNPAGKVKRGTFAQLAALLSGGGGGDDGGGGGGDDVAWTLYSQAAETVETTGTTTGGTVGLHFSVSEACPLAALWLYSPSGHSLTVLPTAIALYDYATNALIHSETGVTWSGAAGSGWVRAAFASPPELAPGTEYTAAAFRSSGAWFIYDSDTGWSGDVTSGPITAPVSDGTQGWYNEDNTTAISFPGSQLAGYNWYLDVEVLAPADSGGGGGGGGGDGDFTAATSPLLAVYLAGGTFAGPPASWPSGPTTNIANQYFSMDPSSPWSEFGAPFIADCNGAGLTAFVEIEPWNYDQSPILFTAITGGSYDTWLTDLGASIAAGGKPVIVTFAHEMNVSGQYPWSWNMSGSGPGGGNLSASAWITGWKYIRAKINSTAGGLALFMWACSADTGGSSTTSPAAWWPGASFLEMVGIDGYEGLDGSPITFNGVFASALSDIRALGWTGGIYIAETSLWLMEDSGGDSIASFVAKMKAAGMTGILDFQDGLTGASPAQWTAYNAAIAANYP